MGLVHCSPSSRTSGIALGTRHARLDCGAKLPHGTVIGGVRTITTRNLHDRVTITLFGGLVVRRGEESPKFRSRSVERMLSRLALRLGRKVPKTELADLLWPDSDGDRQAQNLRRAISDLRQALDPSMPDAWLQSDPGHLWLSEDGIDLDVARFRHLVTSRLDDVDGGGALEEAIALYVGPLLADDDDPSLGVYRLELEELFAQATDRLISRLLSHEKHEEALRLGRQAVTVAPLREDVHVALIRAYASAGLHSEAIRQYEELERLLDEHFGEAPSQRSLDALGEKRPKPSSNPQAATPLAPTPQGAGYYVERESDRLMRRALAAGEGTILIHGPRQVGKTSLLARALNQVRSGDARAVITDFQVLSKSQLVGAEVFCKCLAAGFALQLGLDYDADAAWNPWLGPNSNLDMAVAHLLSQSEGKVVWAMDEADRLFGTDFADDFYGLVRSWHNRRALEPHGPFSRLALVISYSIEAHLFIQDIHQSPFNVGLRIPIKDFGLAETAELSSRYAISLSPDDLGRLHELTGGQPFLSRRAMECLAEGLHSLESLAATASDEDGPFGDHLRRLGHLIEQDESNSGQVLNFLRGEPIENRKALVRLMASGVLCRHAEGIRFRVPLYREYLLRLLA